MSLRSDYEQLNTPELKRLLSTAKTVRHIDLITTILTERGEHPVIWTVKRKGWVWTAPGWQITRLRRVSPTTLAEETVYQVWCGTRIYAESRALSLAKQVVQRAEDSRLPRVDYEPGEQHLYESPTLPTRGVPYCYVCGEPPNAEIHHVVPEGWCQWDEEDHDYRPGDPECRRCGAEEPYEED